MWIWQSICESSYLFNTSWPRDIHIICKNGRQETAINQGILTLEEGCQLKTKTLKFQATISRHKVATTKFMQRFDTLLRNETLKVIKGLHNQTYTEQDLPTLDTSQIEGLMTEAQNTSLPHLTFTYISTALTVICIITLIMLYKCRKLIPRASNNETTRAPTAFTRRTKSLR